MSRLFRNRGLLAQSQRELKGIKGTIQPLSRIGSQQGGIPARNQTWDSQAKAQTQLGLPFRGNLLRQPPECNANLMQNCVFLPRSSCQKCRNSGLMPLIFKRLRRVSAIKAINPVAISPFGRLKGVCFVAVSSEFLNPVFGKLLTARRQYL